MYMNEIINICCMYGCNGQLLTYVGKKLGESFSPLLMNCGGLKSHVKNESAHNFLSWLDSSTSQSAAYQGSKYACPSCNSKEKEKALVEMHAKVRRETLFGYCFFQLIYTWSLKSPWSSM